MACGCDTSDNVRRKRIGNDLRFNWSIKDGDGNDYDLEGKDLLLSVKSPLGAMPYGDLEIVGNIISFTLYGKDQRVHGLYSAILVENDGEVGMKTVDITDIVRLVPHTSQEGGEDRCSHLSVETIDLKSTVVAGIPGPRGVGIASVEQVGTSPEDEGVNIIRVTLTNGTYSDFEVRNGSKGDPGSDADVTRANIEAALDGSDGKNLSTEDYTTEEKAKLAGIANGAGVVIVQSDWSQNDSTADDHVKNRTHFLEKGGVAFYTDQELTDAISEDAALELFNSYVAGMNISQHYGNNSGKDRLFGKILYYSESYPQDNGNIYTVEFFKGISGNKYFIGIHSQSVSAQRDYVELANDGIFTINDFIENNGLRSTYTIVSTEDVYHKLDNRYLDLDTAPVSGSGKPVTSGGVATAIASFVTRSVNDLANYYLKSETYTKEEVAALIGAIRQFHYEVYAALPATGEGNVLYLIGPTGSGSDRYEEYVYANNAFVKIGDTSIDLSGYVTTQALNTALANYTTTADLTALLAGKEDTSNKVSTIEGNESDTTKYPNTKAVYDAVNPPVGSSMPSGGFLPNILYNLGTITEDTAFLLASAPDANVPNHWYWVFEVAATEEEVEGETVTTLPDITGPQGITWATGSAPTIQDGKHYEISVMYGVGAYLMV